MKGANTFFAQDAETKTVLYANADVSGKDETCEIQHLRLCQKLRGYYQYFGVRGNYESICAVYVCAKKFWRCRLSRRSHKGGMDWKKFDKFHNLDKPEPYLF